MSNKLLQDHKNTKYFGKKLSFTVPVQKNHAIILTPPALLLRV